MNPDPFLDDPGETLEENFAESPKQDCNKALVWTSLCLSGVCLLTVVLLLIL